jgi:hypothetical protein
MLHKKNDTFIGVDPTFFFWEKDYPCNIYQLGMRLYVIHFAQGSTESLAWVLSCE